MDSTVTPAGAVWAAAAEPRSRTARHVLRLAVLVLPAAVLGLGAATAAGTTASLFGLGAAVLFVLALILLPQTRIASPATGLAVIALYVLAQVWLWYCNRSYHEHWYPHLALGALLVAPILLFGAVTLVGTGAHDLRRARLVSRQLVERTSWPADLSYCSLLPETAVLRDAVHAEAAPALALLDDPRPEVRVAALTAMAYRKHWQPGQARVVQILAEKAAEPEVRAAAIRALAFSRDRHQVESLAQFLRDPSPLVRHAAGEVLFWDSERRWSWIRFGVHEALANPALRNEGPLTLAGVTLPEQALADLIEWTGEGGAQSVRSALTLAAYYGQALSGAPDPDLTDGIRRKVLDPHAPTVLRMELAQLLLEQRLFDRGSLTTLLAAEHPVPMRLLAADAILAGGPAPEAAQTLREIAVRPNREIALAVAQVLQRRLGVELRLPQPLPPVQSRQAAEITRRVMEWATAEVSEPPPTSDESFSVPAVEPQAKPPPQTEWDLPPPKSGAGW